MDKHAGWRRGDVAAVVTDDFCNFAAGINQLKIISHKMEMNKAKGHLAMLGANVMWGLMSPVAKMVFAAGVVAPMIMVDFRVAGAAALFWLTSLFLPREHVPLRDILRLAGAGMLGVLFNQGFFIVGVSLTSPGEASLVTTTMPDRKSTRLNSSHRT